MRHMKRKRNLGMSPSHRSSLLKNLATSILDKERLTTTVAKAKEVRGLVERLITYGKRGGLHQIRIAGKIIQDKTVLHKLFSDIAPSFKEREGGYTRIIKVGERKGDNALMVIIELVGRSAGEISRMRKKQKKQDKAPATDAKAAKAESVEKGKEDSTEPKAAKPKKEKPEARKKEPAKEKKPKAAPAEKTEEKKEKAPKAEKAETEKKKKAEK
jgi:large subunit ribosomal protein L17